VMDPNTPMTMAGALYKTRPEAVEAFETVWGARHQGEFDHMALAVLTKDENGQLQVERHDSTTKHLAWAGVAVGAALCVVCPPAGIAVVAAGAGAGAGIGAWVGHFWNQIPKEDINELSDLLDSGESAIFVVTVNPKETDITPLLMHPERYKVFQTKAGDWDAVADQAIKQAETDQAAREKAAAGGAQGS
jgi:uncharacterized membrane protein